MEVDQRVSYIDEVLTVPSDALDSLLPAIRKIKNTVIGNDKQKAYIISQGVIPRLLQLMMDDSISIELRQESAIVLGSLAKGTEGNIQSLLDSGCIDALLAGIGSTHLPYLEACLRCLRTVFASDNSPTSIIYRDAYYVQRLIEVIPISFCTQECATSILASCCKEVQHQNALSQNGAIQKLVPLLNTDIYKIQMPALRCLAAMCYSNSHVSKQLTRASHCGENVLTMILRLQQRDCTTDMQMLAAKCMTHMCRAGAIDSHDHMITHKTLPTLIRMCSASCTWEERVEGAELLAYLTEVDQHLQELAAISDHIISLLSDYFKYPGSPLVTHLMPTKKDDIIVGNELRQAAFRCYASLAANNEEIRKRIIETEHMMDYIVNGLSDPVTKVQLAAIRCMHSLSRSVQQLRTSFQDHNVWEPLMKILLSKPTTDVLIVASSTLCNLLLDFSPSKEPILKEGAIQLLADLTRNSESQLKLNGVWALMNLAFQADQQVKTDILEAISADELFRLLSDSNVHVLMKTLGLLRNLLSSKAHIDNIMKVYGSRVMQAVILILEGEHKVAVKEQALCILANVADGNSAKNFVMENDDILKKLRSYMAGSQTRLQAASTFCITNLVWQEDKGSYDRQEKLKELGIHALLLDMRSCQDTTLFEKVKTALAQFPAD